MRRKAIKVVDMLQLSAELGNTEALFTLAYVSLVPVIISRAVVATFDKIISSRPIFIFYQTPD